MRGPDGWLAIFRLVTPALLTLLLWIVTTGLGEVKQDLQHVQGNVEQLRNDYFHELVLIKERLTRIETKLSLP